MRLPRPPALSWTIRAPLVALLVLSIAAAGACTDQRPATPAPAAGGAVPTPPELRWEGCGGRLQCARLRVPLDYAKPAGETIELALVRAPARKPQQRIGSLLVNPGGPGGSGVSFVRATADGFYGQQLRDRFDIVGFDPRGVGGSAPIRCQSDAEKDSDLATADVVPEDAAEHAELVDSSRRFAAGCAKSSARLLPYLSTESAARDMDVLRAALGDDKLSYLGISYGSVLGATYASIFPTRVRAMVLDAAVDPVVWINQPEETVRAQAQGFERAFDAFLADCRARRGDCGFGAGNPGGAYDRLVERLDDAPIQAKSTADSRPVNAFVAFLAVNAALYNRLAWPQLADALEMADEEGDGGPTGSTTTSTTPTRASTASTRSTRRTSPPTTACPRSSASRARASAAPSATPASSARTGRSRRRPATRARSARRVRRRSWSWARRATRRRRMPGRSRSPAGSPPASCSPGAASTTVPMA
jgi:pimeloyl-ACP methyl ester carboxylesterase